MTAPTVLFLSHGSPMIALQRSAASDFLVELGATLPKPKAVLAVSAHWQTEETTVGAAALPRTIHDFYGFPPQLHAMTYDAAGDPDLARRVAAALPAKLDPQRGLDHGIWTVAKLMWPDADVPVVPVSLTYHEDAWVHWTLGERLRPLLEEGVMLLASGAASHNLAALRRQHLQDSLPEWLAGFTDWLAAKVEAGDGAALRDTLRQAPYARINHPSDEHFLPLLVAAAAGGKGGRILHRSVEHYSIAMDSYAWD